MRLQIDPGFLRALRNQQFARKQLGVLERLVNSGHSIPQSWFKPSGTGRTGTFAPYLQLKLYHAKLDQPGRSSGDPILVFQEMEPGYYKALAMTTHGDFATYSTP
jgi:hypothetical protein